MMNSKESLQIQHLTGLRPREFADLIRVAQLVFDPASGVSGRSVKVVWETLGIPSSVVENLKTLGQKYQYASPHIAIAIIWEQLTPETRNWMIEHKRQLWQIEELLPALDED